jgi:hypothetical protein
MVECVRVSRLSEIATADGARIRPVDLEGHRLRFTKHDSPGRPLAKLDVWSRMLGKSCTTHPLLLVWASGNRRSGRLVSVDTVPEKSFSRLPDGSYEVFERTQDAIAFSGFPELSPRRSTTFELCLQKYRLRPSTNKVLHRGRRHLHPGPTSFEYVAQQPTHPTAFTRLRSLETAAKAYVSLICSPVPSTEVLTTGGLLSGLVLMALFGEYLPRDELYQSVRHVPWGLHIRRRNRVLIAALTHLRLVSSFKQDRLVIHCDSKCSYSVANKYFDGFVLAGAARTTISKLHYGPAC